MPAAFLSHLSGCFIKPFNADVPTIAEQGFPGFEASSWFGIFTKGGTSKKTIEKIAEDINWALKSPEMQEKLTSAGVFAAGGTPEEFQRYLDSETQRWGKIIKDKNIKIQ